MATSNNNDKQTPPAANDNDLQARVEGLEALLTEYAKKNEALTNEVTELKNSVKNPKPAPAAATPKREIPKKTFKVDGTEYQFLMPRFNFFFNRQRREFLAVEALENKEVLAALVKGQHWSVIEAVKK